MTAPKAHHGQVWESWGRWFDQAMYEVRGLYLDRNMFVAMRDAIVQHAPNEPAPWLTHHYARCYRDKQTMAVRRVMDTDEKAMAFGRLLHAMETSPQVFTLDRLLSGTETTDEYLLGELRDFFGKVQAAGSNHVDPEWVRGFREQLSADLTRLLKFADRRVAHFDQREPEPPLTWGQLHEAVDLLGNSLQEFGLHFRATHYVMEPYMDNDWRKPFRRQIFETL